MLFLTGAYRGVSNQSALILQQLTRKDHIPVLFACVLMSGDKEQTKKYEYAREEHPANKLTDWFYESVLPGCRRGSAEKCTDRVRKLFAEVAAKLTETCGPEIPDSVAVFFAMGEECFYAWKGAADIRIFHNCFDRMTGETLTWYSEELVCRRARLEPQVGILLGNQSFFEHMDKRSLEDCLRVPDLQEGVQVERHLAEVAMAAERNSARDVTLIFLRTKE